VLLPGTVEQDRVRCELGELPLAAPLRDGSVDVMVRPEQIRLLHDRETPPAGSVAYDAIVTEVVFQGQDAGVALQLQSGTRPIVRARVPGYLCPKPGAQVRLAVDGEVTAYPRG
jgi:iron(III) transport system ATP-binding protein